MPRRPAHQTTRAVSQPALHRRAGSYRLSPKELAEKFPQLEILELLGQGGMGAVYKARQKQLDRLVALKILPPEIGRDPAFAERFTREARSMAKLSHQHVVTLYEFGHTEDGLYYFLMEFVDGTDLRHVIQTGELGTDETLAIVPQVCEALQYAHEEGIVHRDIKPENILLDKKGRVKIADFGLARLLDRPATSFTLTQAGQRMGTPHYMAPEQIQGAHEVDHRADIYSLGVVFYEMLTGQLPIGQFAPPSQKVQVDVRLDKVVLKSLAHEPERRYQHASEVKTDVETIAGQERMITRPFEHPDAEAVRQQVRRPAIGLLATGIVNWIGTGVVMFTLGYLELIPGYALLITGPGMLILSGFIFFAALKMMRLEAYRWALVAAILAMIVSPGNIIGLPFGVWALVVLTSSQVKAAFAGKKKVAESKTSEPKAKTSQRRFSRAAIVGACCIPFAVLLLIPPMVLTDPKPLRSSEFFNMMRDTTGGFVLVILFGLVGLATVFGTTILGIVSITHIRHSAGRLYGMGLALFDALLFPLLVIDGLIIWLVFFLASLPSGEFAYLLIPRHIPPGLILPAMMVCATVDIVIIHRAWRKANAGLERPQIQTGKAPLAGGTPLEQAKQELHDVNRQAESTGGAMSSTATSTVGRAWQQWWSERDRHTTKAIKAVLLVVYVICLLAFFGPHGSVQFPKGTFKYEVGFPSPWFTLEKYESGHSFFVTLSSAWIVAAVGFIACYAYWRIKRTEGSSLGRLDSPRAQGIIWAVFAIIAMSVGFVPLVIATIKSQSMIVTNDVPIPPDEPAAFTQWDGTQDKWILRPEGPALSDGFARISLELQPSQVQKFNEILQATYKEYQVLLEQHTQQDTDEDGHLITTITPFPKDITKLDERMWSELDPILNEKQQGLARLNLPLHPKRAVGTRSLHDRGIFGWGDHNFRIEIWRVGQWYHWIVRDESISPSPFPEQRQSELPEEFRRFWEKAGMDK